MLGRALMAGVPDFLANGPWWGLFGFLFVVVFCRAQGTYWVGRSIRRGLSGPANPDGTETLQTPGRRARLARHFSGPTWERARRFLDRWGFLGVPVSFLTIGFQTMVNAAAGFGRMRWDLYTLAMLPGCAAWAAIYAVLGVGLVEAWARSPWLFLGIVIAIVLVAWVFTTLRRRRKAREGAPKD